MIVKRMEVNLMLYCARCQVLAGAGVECPSCGSKKLREVRPNDPVLLLMADETECAAIRAAFDDGGIAHEERMCGPGTPPSILYGKMPGADYRIFVPFGELDRCRDILRGIGVLGEDGKVQRPASPFEEEEKPAGGGLRRAFFRIGAALLFLAAVALAVGLADKLAAFFKSVFL